MADSTPFSSRTHPFTGEDFAPTPAPLQGYALGVEGGPESGLTATVSGSEPGEVIVGQSPACALRLSDPTASRRHAAFEVKGARLRVRDLGSTNGTYIGTVRVVEGYASPGDVVTVGRTALRVHQGGPPAALPYADHFGDVIGTSREMRRLYPLLARIAASSLPVLIEGETGTGKEAVALEMHRQSARASGPFALFDCTVATPSLIESELFGHERGAFTGATTQKRGVFEQAHGGTLFLDEIGDLPLDLQAKLLRAIETGQIRRVGGERWLQVSTRLVTATRRDLEASIQKGTFRDDLFHRLAVGRVALPPLRERRGDIPVLVEHFCTQQGAPLTQIPRHVSSAWGAHPWPGNVRELRNAVARQLALGELDEQASRPLPSAMPPSTDSAGQAFEQLLDALAPYDQARQQTLDLFQREYLERVLRAAGGSVQRGADLAGIALRYFQLLRARSRKGAGSTGGDPR